jgi:hypothetical protein
VHHHPGDAGEGELALEDLLERGTVEAAALLLDPDADARDREGDGSSLDDHLERDQVREDLENHLHAMPPENE